MSKEKLIEVFEDTKIICASIPTPVSEKFNGSPMNKLLEKEGTVIVEPLDTVSALLLYSTNGGKTAVLNMASSKRPGGGVAKGAMAQEECLFRCSNLYTIPTEFYPLVNNEFIYTKDASFVKDVNYNPIEPMKADVITIAAPNLNKDYHGNIINQSTIDNYDSIMIHKMVAMFDIAALNGCVNLILGAWGCGVFKNDPKKVAELFNHIIFHKRTMFNNIVFAVINDHNSVGNNYQIFKDTIVI